MQNPAMLGRDILSLSWTNEMIYTTEAHKGHHCKYFSARFFYFRKVVFLFPQVFFYFRKFFLFISARLVYFRMVKLYFRKVKLYFRGYLYQSITSAKFIWFPQGYLITARFVLFPQGYFNFRENIFNGNHQGTGRPRSFGVMARFEQYCRDIGIGESQIEKMNDEKVCMTRICQRKK